VESVRTSRGPQHRTLAYLGELNGTSEAAWRRTISVFNQDGAEHQLELFVADSPSLPSGERVVQVRLDGVRWERPREFGEAFLARHLWHVLGLDRLMAELMPEADEKIPWAVVSFILCAARLLSPSSELAIEEQFYPKTALDDLTGVAVEKINSDRLYRGLDQLLPHKSRIEGHLKEKVGRLFGESFDLLLYDLTSTYFEGIGTEAKGKARGYSRDHRPDCLQIVIGLVVTKGGFPLGYEVFAGNRNDATTLGEMIEKMEALYGRASRIWVFDRGVASEENLETLRQRGGLYLVGTPRTMLRRVEAALFEKDWKQVREGIEARLVPVPDGESDTFILCRSSERRDKEAGMHTRFQVRMEDDLERIAKSIASGRLRSRDALFQRLGRLRKECSRVARAYRIDVVGDGETLALSWRKDDAHLEFQRRAEGTYLLRTNLSGRSEQELWRMYMQLNDAEAAFRTLKQDLSIRPIHHQLQRRIEAHVLVCFIAYAMYQTLEHLSGQHGIAMSARKVLAALAGIKSGDVILPLVDGRELRLRRVSRPDVHQAQILARLKLSLPERLGDDTLSSTPLVVQTYRVRPPGINDLPAENPL
jgi:transposase